MTMVNYNALNDLISRFELNEDNLMYSYSLETMPNDDEFRKIFLSLKNAPFADMYHFSHAYMALVCNMRYVNIVNRQTIFKHVNKRLEHANYPTVELTHDELKQEKYDINQWLATIFYYTRNYLKRDFTSINLQVLRNNKVINRVTDFLKANYSLYGQKYFLVYIEGIDER